MSRELFAREALAHIPKLLTLQDRNRHSPTYGCFDRNFWHYKTIDFPSGMAQEFVWPLAMAYVMDIPGNPFYQKPAIGEWAEAGIRFAARSSRADGSCDDYYPYERASGAAAFSLLACVESYVCLGLRDEGLLRFFATRGDWLARHHESGQLANHQALIALCLELLSRLLRTTKWEESKRERIERVLSWQSPEGWFKEYEGCDPGYHTLTVSLLARLYDLGPTTELEDAIVRAVRFAAHFVHPDGSYGGEYGSRNTYNFFPHGFELAGKWLPEALSIDDRFLTGLASGLAPCYADDHIVGHHVWNYLLAWRDFVEDRPSPPLRAIGRAWFKGAKILIDRREGAELYLALNKGGVFKFFRNGALVASDTQFSVEVVNNRKVRNAVGHLTGDYESTVGEDEIVIRGALGWAKQRQMTSAGLVALRLLMLFVGRFFPNAIRRVLQRMLIVGKRGAPFAFSRSFRWDGYTWVVSDELRSRSWGNVLRAAIGCDQTSIYVAMGRVFQVGQLQPWIDLTDAVRGLAPGQTLRVDRSL